MKAIRKWEISGVFISVVISTFIILLTGGDNMFWEIIAILLMASIAFLVIYRGIKEDKKNSRERRILRENNYRPQIICKIPKQSNLGFYIYNPRVNIKIARPI